jgi:hypothetical protein
VSKHESKEEELKLLKEKEAKEELQRAKHEGVLNIQLLAIRSPPHSSSSLECQEGKVYNEKMQFMQTIIHNVYKTRTSVVEFCVEAENVSVQESKQD